MSDFVKKLGEDLWNEGRRQIIQGSAELANALFNGSSYVPYGAGQFIRATQQEQEQAGQEQQMESPQRERGGMEM